MAFQVAQWNVGRGLHPVDHPQIKEFMDGLDHINTLAEQSRGFVWRLKTESGNAIDVQHRWSTNPFRLVNMSVWKSPDDLKDFAYRASHLDYYLKRAQWFEKPTETHYVLWWVPAGQISSLEEAREGLKHYRAHGATPHVFWFGKLFPAPSEFGVPV